MDKRLLVVTAHPDDEVLGCGGTVARMVDEGWEATILILGEGAASRSPEPTEGHRAAMTELARAAHAAARVLGVADLRVESFPDNCFDSVPLLELVRSVERVKRDVSPAIVFTHDWHDLNVDHRCTHDAVVTATRPMRGESVRAVYAFEILSSSEWRFPAGFVPDTFVPIESTLERKLLAMREYSSELRDYPHPRSLEGISTLARYRGMNVGTEAAEAFRTVRSVWPSALSNAR